MTEAATGDQLMLAHRQKASMLGVTGLEKRLQGRLTNLPLLNFLYEEKRTPLVCPVGNPIPIPIPRPELTM